MSKNIRGFFLLQTEANFEMTELLQTDIKSILNLLLLHLTTHHTRVVAAIKLLATMNQSSVVYDTDEKIVRGREESCEIYLMEHMQEMDAIISFPIITYNVFDLLKAAYPFFSIRNHRISPHPLLTLSSSSPHPLLILSSSSPHPLLILSSSSPHPLLILSSSSPHPLQGFIERGGGGGGGGTGISTPQEKFPPSRF